MDTKSRYSTNVRRVSVLSARRKTSSDLESNSKETEIQDDGHVKVAVRCRPMSEKELIAGYESIVEFESDHRIVVHDVSEQPSDQLGTKSGERRNISHVYDFDHVFGYDAKQQDVYDQVCRPIVNGALEGYNGTIFAYGQTGTGKTYTMEGHNWRLQRSTNDTKQHRRRSSGIEAGIVAVGSGTDQASKERQSADLGKEADDHHHQAGNEQAGIIPRTFEQIFAHIRDRSEVKFLVRASYLEVYQEEIRDLLRKDKTNKLELHERTDIGVYVKDLTSFVCKSIEEIERVMRVGNQNRIVGATDMNEHSSRSHAIFMITIEQQEQLKQLKSTDTKLQTSAIGEELVGSQAEPGKSEPVIRVGKLNLVDLAGSERQRKTNSYGQRQKESIKINSSLSALGNVINALMKLQKQREQQVDVGAASLTPERAASAAKPNSPPPIHTPYRDSKLTRLLQDSLGGNAKTLMIANIGPASYNYDETINTLNYASRARCIKNRPRLNEDPKDALLRELQKEIELLRAKLAANQSGGNGSHANINKTNQISDSQSSGVSSAKSSRGGSGADGTRRNSLALARGPNMSISDEISTNSTNNNNNKEPLLIEKEFFELKQKLSSLESKLLNSDRFDLQSSPTRRELDHKSILMGLTREQELELERRQEELAKQVVRERAIRDELERREEAELSAKQSFESVQQEIEAKRRLIWQVLLKVKSIRDEISLTQQAYRTELDELEQIQFVLQKELKLKCLIMDNFIPNDHVDQLIGRVNYDERRNLCFIKPLDLAPLNDQGRCLVSERIARDGKSLADYLRNPNATSTASYIRPRSELERLSETINPSNIRYKFENLIDPSLFFIDFGYKRQNQAKSQADIIACRQLKPRRLCDMLNERSDHSTPFENRNFPRTDGKDFTGQLQATINDALSKREPDIVI